MMTVLTLAPSLVGRAGFQMVEQGAAARMLRLHQHGVPGEAEYIRHFRAPAPFVHNHCHRPATDAEQQTPAQLAAGALLFSPVLCGDQLALPITPAAHTWTADVEARLPAATTVTPWTPPPRV